MVCLHLIIFTTYLYHDSYNMNLKLIYCESIQSNLKDYYYYYYLQIYILITYTYIIVYVFIEIFMYPVLSYLFYVYV